MALTDQQITSRLRPEYRGIYESFRGMGMDQETALRATAGRDKTAADIVTSESAGVVESFQGLGLSLNEAETAARGRPSQGRDLLTKRRRPLSEQADGTGSGSGDSEPDRDTIIALWIEDLAVFGGLSQEEAQAHVQLRLAGDDNGTGNSEQTESARRRRTVSLYESSGRIEHLEGK